VQLQAQGQSSGGSRLDDCNAHSAAFRSQSPQITTIIPEHKYPRSSSPTHVIQPVDHPGELVVGAGGDDGGDDGANAGAGQHARQHAVLKERLDNSLGGWGWVGGEVGVGACWLL